MKKLVLASILLALVVIVLGAYTRLTDAGLGCPDWPGCYGHLTIPQTEEHIAIANEAYPERPVEAEKAWNEMVHRYFAAALGFFILVISIIALTNRAYNRPLKLPLLLLGLVIFQGMLGMWKSLPSEFGLCHYRACHLLCEWPLYLLTHFVREFVSGSFIHYLWKVDSARITTICSTTP